MEQDENKPNTNKSFGNQFWRQRSRHGPKPKFDGPEKLMESCIDYFQWVEDNPLLEDSVGFYEGRATHEPKAKMRAMTIGGLCIFIDVTMDTWCEWRKSRKDLSDVITWAEGVIKEQKFTGAAAGLLSHHIIARDLGLTDKTALQNLDRNGNPTDPAGSGIGEHLEGIAAALDKALRPKDEA